MRNLVVVLACALSGAMLSGCAAIAIVDTAIDVTTTVVGTTVDVAAGAVRTVAGSSDKKDEKVDCADKDNKDKDECKKQKPD